MKPEELERLKLALDIPENTPTAEEALEALALQYGGELPPIRIVKFREPPGGLLDFVTPLLRRKR